MVLFLNAHPDTWLDGVAAAGQDLRLQLASAFLTGASPSGSTGIASRPGVRYGTGNPLQVNAASGMNITVNAGVAWVQGTASATAGMYTCCLDTTGTITVATSDPTNPRIDNVICQITDNGNSSSTTVVTLQTGTPAPSPVAPTLPANSLLLATVAVGAGVSSITAGNIADARVYTAASGGIVPVANTSGGISGQAGLYVHNLATGRMQVSDGAGNARQPKTAAFTPATSVVTTVVSAAPNTTSTITSVSITTDGQTEIKVEGTLAGLWQSASPTVGDIALLQFLLDGTAIQGGTYRWAQPAANAQVTGAGTFSAWATPSAGTHTVTWNLIAGNTNTAGVRTEVSGASEYTTLRVGPSFS
jgi:hypothetical protein